MENTSYWYVQIDLNTGAVINHEEHFAKRFINDKCYFEDKETLIYADGLLLNRTELLNEFGLESYANLLKKVMSEPELLKKFRGCFTAFIFDKKNSIGLTFGNQTGDVSVFYSFDRFSNCLKVSNNFNHLRKHCGESLLDEQSAHYLLTYGFIIDNGTLCSNIKRLQAGKILCIQSGKFIINTYHRFKYSYDSTLDYPSILKRTNDLFIQAVQRCINKDLEYGYTEHLVDLSAGLDSRMVNWVIKRLGYENIVNISYSQSFSDEDKYSQLVANKLTNEYYHQSIDDAKFMFEPDEMSKQTYGLAYYFGITGGYRFLNRLNLRRFGCEHTGQLGDVVLGAFSVSNGKNINYDTYRNSKLLKLRLGEIDEKYDSQDEFNLYTRGFQGALTTHYMRNEYCYALSPFLDVDFMEFLCSLPRKVRENHKLYWDWIQLYYSDALELPSSRKRIANITTLFINKCIQKIKAEHIRLLKKLGINKNLRNHMNPYDYWLANNHNLSNFVDKYYHNNINLLVDYPQIMADCNLLFNNNSALDKLMVISLLAGVKNLVRK